MNKHFLRIIFFLLLGGIFQNTNGENIDSLINLYKTGNTSLERLKAFNEIRWTLYKGDLEEGLTLLDEAIEIAKREKNYKALAKAYEGKAIFSSRDGKATIAEDYLSQAITYAEKSDAYKTKFNIYIRMADLQGFKGQYEKQDSLLNMVLLDKKSKDYPAIRGTVYSSIGIMYFYKAKHRKSLPYFYKSTKIFEEVGDLLNVAFSQESIGRTYSNLGKNDSALQWFQIAYVNYKKSESETYYGSITYNLAYAFYNNEQNDSAISYYIKANEHFGTSENKPGMGMSLEGIGMVYKESGLFDKALLYYFEAEEILKGTETRFTVEVGDFQSLFSGF